MDVTSDRDVRMALEAVTNVLEETGGELLAIVNNVRRRLRLRLRVPSCRPRGAEPRGA